jgi:protein-S-isoprenylcysteine O-methyltransferase Ste14
MSAFVWAGGAMFVGALAFCGYSYAVTWSHAAGAFRGTPAGVDALLFSVFALHHTLFARDRAKRWLSRAVPDAALRSVYVWLASILLIGVCLAWQPVGGEFDRHSGALGAAHLGLQLAGVFVIARAVGAIDALELAGIRPHSGPDALQIVGPYRVVRHPLYSGWLLVTFGAAHMTGDRLVFAGISTLYLLIAMPFEERSLRKSVGEAYAEYARKVRYRLVPYVY